MTSDDPPTAHPAPEAGVADAEERSLARRLRDRRVLVEQRFVSTRDRLEAARPHSGAIDTAFRAFERDVATGGGVLSAAVAFRVFLFFVPYVFVLVTGFGVAADAAGKSPRDLARDTGITGLIAHAFTGVTDLDTVSRVTALVVSLFALFLAARGAVKVLRIVHGLVWRVPIPRLASASRAAGVLIGVVTVFLAIGVAVDKLREQSLLLGVLGLVVSAAVPFGAWLLVSSLLPHAPSPWWALAPGAGLFAIGATGLHALTVYFIAYEVSAKSETYGAIGTSLALLLWAYLLGRVITAAASVNASFWYRNEERLGHDVPTEMDLEVQLSAPPRPESSV
ncbi:MAG: YhjD/YihY/BrkB family envelope integrity protein [Acidimicrobiia bacterium]